MKKNKLEAVKWLQKSIDHGNKEAQGYLDDVEKEGASKTQDQPSSNPEYENWIGYWDKDGTREFYFYKDDNGNYKIQPQTQTDYPNIKFFISGKHMHRVDHGPNDSYSAYDLDLSDDGSSATGDWWTGVGWNANGGKQSVTFYREK